MGQRSLIAVLVVVFVSGLPVAPAAGAEPAVERTGVVERTGGESAVILLEAGGEQVGQRVVALDAVPEAGRHEGAVLRVRGTHYAYDPAATDRRERARSRELEANSRQFDARAGRRTEAAPGTGASLRVRECCEGRPLRERSSRTDWPPPRRWFGHARAVATARRLRGAVRPPVRGMRFERMDLYRSGS